MRRIAPVTATALLLTGLTALPAAADRPVEFTDSASFVDINPCSGLPEVITINSTFRVHEHGERFVAHLSRTGSMTSGYVMDHGVEHQQANGSMFSAGFVDNWQSADGSRLQARGVFVAEDGSGDVRVDLGSLRCIKA